MGTSPPQPQRRLALVALVAVASLFLLELVALIMGWFAVAVVCAALLVVAWFVMRSIVKRRQRAEAGPS